MQPRGLIGLGTDTLDHCGPEIKQVFDVLVDEAAYPVLIHCTQGKDRTGITILLVLLLCGVDLAAITADYVKSEVELEPEKEERMKEIRSIGLDETFASCPPDFCEKIRAYIDTKYGGVSEYLRGIGIDDQQQELLKAMLLK
jgi:protein-tyrosine phosphatase